MRKIYGALPGSKEHRLTELRQRLDELDYIGVKIATGRATQEEYAAEIAEMETLAAEINAIEGGNGLG